MNLDQLQGAIEQWGKDRNIIGAGTANDQFRKLVSEVGELSDGLSAKNQEEIKDGIGDTAVVLTIMAAQCGMTLTECVQHAYDTIKDRKGILYDGVFVKEADHRYPEVYKAVHGVYPEPVRKFFGSDTDQTQA